MASFTAGTTFVDGVSNDVTASKLGNLVTNATPTSGFIQDRTAETVTATNDTLLIGDASDSNNLKRITVANFAQTLPTTKVTTGTIETGTFGTTTSTAATITTGTIPTLVATTLVTTGTGTAAAPAIVPTGDTNTGIFFPAADTIAFSEGGAEAMRIDSSGNVGIGTTSPSALLHVSGSGSNAIKITGGSNANQGSYAVFQKGSTDRLFVGVASAILGGGSTSNDSMVWTESTNNTLFYTNGGERLRIDGSGRVGINVTSPLYKLQVDGDAALTDTSSLYWATAGGTTRTSITGDSSGNLKLQTGASNTERLRIDSSGNVGIGVTVGTIAGDAGPLMVSSTSAVPILAARSGDGNVMRFYRSGTQVGSINLTSGATAYVTSSDYRLKTNLEPISNGIERVKQLPVYRFNWIENQSGNKVDGFVAHEAQAIVPECVVGEKDAVDADGKPIHQGIDQSKIVPLLTAALKEAITKIEVLESKVAALEAA
jgi:hypothetical protein